MTRTAPAIVVIAALAACVPPPATGPGVGPGAQPVAQPAGAGAFSGTFVTQGGSMTLEDRGGEVTGSITGSGISGSIQGTVSGAQLDGMFTMSDGSSGAFVAYATADGVQVTVEGGAPIAFVRAGAGAGATVAGTDATTAPVTAPAAPVAKTGALAPAPSGKAATGARVADELRGWAVKTPAKWKFGVKDGRQVFGSDTEAGVIAVMFMPSVTFEQAEAQIDTEIQKLGATPVGRARAHEFKAGQGLVAEMSAVGGDGVELRGRADVIVGPRGALVLLGITTEPKFATLRKRVDAIALSTAFFTPKEPPKGNVGAVAGCFRYSAGTSVSVERTLRFDGQGGVSYNGASFANVESKDSSGNVTARTSALSEGNPDLGVYTVAAGDKQVQIRWGDGSTAAYELVWENGKVGAVKDGDRWYLGCD